MMKIIQITDLHVPTDRGNSMGVDVRKNFLETLRSIRSLAPDFIAVTGDICYDTADEQTYRWVRVHLDSLKIPYAVISGNHDSPKMVAQAFGTEHLLVGEELFYRREMKGHHLLFLETSTGEVSQKQLAWLEHELSKLKGQTVIFMHHPPLVGGVPHMDQNYALRNMAEVQEVLFNFPHHLSIFCGHYHVEKTLCLRNLTVHITPSLYFQIDWQVEGFRVDHYRTGLREILLRDDGAVESTVIYHEGNKTVDD